MIKNPYFCLKVELSGEDHLMDELRGMFEGIEIEPLSSDYHISMEYSQDDCEIDKIKKISEDVTEFIKSNLKNLQTGKLKLLKGLVTNYDYIVLEIRKDNELMSAIEHIESELNPKEFDGDICTHISLFRIPKLNPEEVDVVSDVVNGFYMISSRKALKIRIKEFRCYDSERNLVESKAA